MFRKLGSLFLLLGGLLSLPLSADYLYQFSGAVNGVPMGFSVIEPALITSANDQCPGGLGCVAMSSVISGTCVDCLPNDAIVGGPYVAEFLPDYAINPAADPDDLLIFFQGVPLDQAFGYAFPLGTFSTPESSASIYGPPLSGTLTITAVAPEPSAGALAATALAVVALRRLRRFGCAQPWTKG